MSYKYYNANALGKIQEDCTVRAISCATNKSWDYVYEHLSDAAQEQGVMMNDAKFIVDYLDERYERIRHIEGTVGEVSEEYKDCVILITMIGHITCSKYGTIYDSFDPRRKKAEYAWIIK